MAGKMDNAQDLINEIFCAGVSRGELLNVLSISRATLWRYEKGKQTPPARVFNVLGAVLVLAKNKENAQHFKDLKARGLALVVAFQMKHIKIKK